MRERIMLRSVFFFLSRSVADCGPLATSVLTFSKTKQTCGRTGAELPDDFAPHYSATPTVGVPAYALGSLMPGTAPPPFPPGPAVLDRPSGTGSRTDQPRKHHVFSRRPPTWSRRPPVGRYRPATVRTRTSGPGPAVRDRVPDRPAPQTQRTGHSRPGPGQTSPANTTFSRDVLQLGVAARLWAGTAPPPFRPVPAVRHQPSGTGSRTD